MGMRRGAVFAAAVVLGALVAMPARAGNHDGDREDNDGDHQPLSPYIVGVWKFVPNGTSPHVDTETRFINPTKLNLVLEYAFFELDGTFCGCDRDEFPPNKTTEYSILDETQLPVPLPPDGPKVFSCTGKSGALKSIVFRTEGDRIVLDKAVQVGFQVHAFGDVVEADSMIRGNVMTEVGMLSVPINDSTRREIQKIHDQCVTVNGPVSQ